jgi:alkylated DNA repair dioxygenase AlkB
MPDCVRYVRGWLPAADTYFETLRREIAWEEHEITIFGRTMATPRLTAWIGEAVYSYSGIVNEPQAWPPAVLEIRDRLVSATGALFNSCLANLYRDGSDSMGYHSDDEPELGDRPWIASVSLGDRRTFVLRHRVSRQKWTWELGEGDLLVMKDESQADYAHAVPKTSKPIGERMNLTFRFFRPVA